MPAAPIHREKSDTRNMKKNDIIPGELLAILACPDCGGNLAPPGGGRANGDALRCEECGRDFEIRNGIPILYPQDINQTRLAEEEKLGDAMKQAGVSPAGVEFFSESQWRESKKEYWIHVKSTLGVQPRRMIINIGCGIDTLFLELRELGHTIIAFDMVFHLLDTLRKKHGSNCNVAGTVKSPPFKKNSFDALCCIDLIHHEHAAIPQILESFRAILKPGGYLFLEDINAWAFYQFPKSILLPKPLHGVLRSFYHRLRRSPHRPPDYEFPTSVWHTRRTLASLGFRDITVVPQRAYPNVCPVGFKLYTILARNEYVRRYHNFYYMILTNVKILI